MSHDVPSTHFNEHDKKHWEIDRAPRVGDKLTPIKTGKGFEDGNWSLEDGEIAIITARNDTPGATQYCVKLRNSHGDVSGWLNPELFYNALNGKAKKGVPVPMKARYEHVVDEKQVLQHCAEVPGKRYGGVKKSREPSKGESKEETAKKGSKARQVYLGAMVVFKEEEGVLQSSCGKNEWVIPTRDALRVAEVNQGTQGHQFRVRTMDGGLSELLSTDKFEHSDGGRILKKGEVEPVYEKPEKKGKKKAPRSGLETAKSMEESMEGSPPRRFKGARGAHLGERVMLKEYEKEPCPGWELGYGDHAVVVDIHEVSGEFKLRNDKGEVSNYQDPRKWQFMYGGDCEKKFVSSKQVKMNPFGTFGKEKVEQRKQARLIKKQVKHDVDIPKPTTNVHTSRSRVCRKGDIVKMTEEDGDELLVVDVDGQTGRVKLRTAAGDITDFVCPNKFRFMENSSPLCLREEQKHWDASKFHQEGILKAPTTCNHYKKPEPKPKKAKFEVGPPIVPVQTVDPEPDAVMGSPVTGDAVDNWQKQAKQKVERQEGHNWDSEDELPSKKETPSATPGGWQEGLKAPEPAAATKSRDLDFGAAAAESPLSPGDGEKEIILTRKPGAKPTMGVIASETTTISVKPGSVAAAAGLKTGNVVKRINGVAVKDGAEVMAQLRAGDKFVLIISTEQGSVKRRKSTVSQGSKASAATTASKASATKKPAAKKAAAKPAAKKPAAKKPSAKR